MKLHHEDYDQLSVIKLRGEFAGESVEQFRKYCAERLSASMRDFVLDVEAVDFIDSQGLESLLWLQEQCAERLGQMRLAALADHVAKILEITRLGPRFDCHADVDSAIKSLR